MSDAPQKKSGRRLRPAPQTMRERAERAANKSQKPKTNRFAWLSRLAVIGKPFQKLGRLKIWKPFRVAGRILGRILLPRYIRNSFRELRQVTWPTRGQTFQLTTAVILFSVIFGLVVALFDFGLDKLFKQVILR